MARILIVDDDEQDRKSLLQFLDGSGHEIIQAPNGEAALSLARLRLPDLAVIDVMMPGLNGFEVTRRLKELAGAEFVPVVLVTALSDPSSKVLGLRVGADEFLVKPIDRFELTSRIANLLALRRKELALLQRNEELLELVRFREEMSALLVHDLKNPLSVVLPNIAFAMEWLQGKPGAGDVLDALGDSLSAGKRAMRLLANLLDLVRVEARRLELHIARTPLGSLVETLLVQRAHAIEARRIEVRVNIAPSLAVEVDADLLTRVIENLLDNALRHTPPGGVIAVEGRRAAAIELRIGNSGPPVPVEARARIFEKFGQSSGGVGRMNLGLGLYFCRLAMEAHGGAIRVEESADLPTVFVLDLPLAAAS